jgi:hypothetical protein
VWQGYCYREQARSHRFSGIHKIRERQIPLWEIGGGRAIAIASKLSPTGSLVYTKFVNDRYLCGSELARDGARSGNEDLQSSFFINPANAANGLCVALAIFGVLSEPSPKYCWSV